MLHVLLMILKIIGIVLLVILGIIAALILLVLFVPVRYRIHVKKEDGPVEADGRIRWLLGFLRADAVLEGKQCEVVIRVLKFKLKTLHFPGGGEKEDAFSADVQHEASSQKVIAQSAAGSDAQISGVLPEKEGTGESADTKPGSRDLKKDTGKKNAEGNFQESADRKRADKKQTGRKQAEKKLSDTAAVPAGNSTKISDKKSAADEKTARESKGNAKISRLRAVLEALPQKILPVLEKILNAALRITHLPYDIYDKTDNILDRLEQKIRAFRWKIDPFLSVEAEHMLGKIIDYLRYLIQGYKPRKISGYLSFGTDAPDLTGKLTGLVYLLLPADSKNYSVEPDFYQTIFRTDTTASGRIHLYRLARVGVKLLIDRETWALIAKIRHKEHSRGKKRGRKKLRSKKAAAKA